MKTWPEKSIDLVVTSPPYNMRMRIRNGQYTEREDAEHFSKKYQYFHDAVPIEEFYKNHKSILLELMRVAKVICYNFQIVTGSKEAFFRLIGDFAKEIKDVMIWDKGTGQPSMNERVLNACYEVIMILENDNKAGRTIQNAKFNRGEMNNILRIGRGSGSEGHGAVMPLELAETLIKSFSDEGDLVYDPFMGTGTVAIACKNTKRNWIGSEITKEYFELAQRRIYGELFL